MTAPRARRPLFTLLAAWLIAACGSTTTVSPSSGPTPTPTPSRADMSGVLAALALSGATVHNVVSGDAGCPDSELHSNAARLELSVPGDEERYHVHLFRWRRAADFTAAGQAFADCVDAYAAEGSGDIFLDIIEIEPWRAYGPAWSEELRTTIENALRDAGGGG